MKTAQATRSVLIDRFDTVARLLQMSSLQIKRWYAGIWRVAMEICPLYKQPKYSEALMTHTDGVL